MSLHVPSALSIPSSPSGSSYAPATPHPPPSTKATFDGSNVTSNFLKVYVPQQHHYLILGKGAANLKKIEVEHKVHIHVPRQETKSDEIRITALTPDNDSLSHARFDMEQLLGYPVSFQPLVTVQYDVAPSAFGLIIGKGGATLRDLQNKCGCAVSLPPSDPSKPSRGPVVEYLTAVGCKTSVDKFEQSLSTLLGSYPRRRGGAQARNSHMLFEEVDFKSAPINEVLFFPETRDSDKKLNRFLSFINSAKSTLDIAVYNMTDDRIANVLLDRHAAGVKIRLISHFSTMEDPGSDVHLMANSGIAVRVDVSPQLMHHKFAVIDNAVVLNGSFNWTHSAAEGNAENVMITNNRDFVDPFAQHYNSMWADDIKLRTLKPHSNI